MITFEAMKVMEKQLEVMLLQLIKGEIEAIEYGDAKQPVTMSQQY
jgi:hypothetical protein